MEEMMNMTPMNLTEVGGGAMAISQGREMQEVQAAVFMAKTFPRDETRSLARIEQACKREGLAKKAVYSYPRGKEQITGPSIRLAEAVAQSWGNIQAGVVELAQKPGETTMMAYAWDIETNTRDTRIFTVKHELHTRNGIKALTDPRDIYEMCANQGARRKRACILAIIPKDIIDSAMEYCQKTLTTGQKEPLIDRIRRLLSGFQNKFSIPQESIEKYMGYKVEAFTEMDGFTLGGIYNALRDGKAKREDYFDLPKADLPKAEKEEAKEEKPEPKKKVKLSEC